MFDFLCDRKILIGIGIGMFLTGLLTLGISIPTNKSMTNAQIEEKARALGMDYPNDFKVINKGGTK